ncbi:MAG: nucleotidyltransferase family protein [Ginsengibacter sp.]|jgi:predicted nucleotidyltransferase
MIDNAKILEQLRHLKPTLQKNFGLTEIALFGSYARNETNSASDIDLLIDLSKNTSSDFFNIAFQLQDLFHPVKVDIVTRKGIKPGYFKSIEKDLIYV